MAEDNAARQQEESEMELAFLEQLVSSLDECKRYHVRCMRTSQLPSSKDQHRVFSNSVGMAAEMIASLLEQRRAERKSIIITGNEDETA